MATIKKRKRSVKIPKKALIHHLFIAVGLFCTISTAPEGLVLEWKPETEWVQLNWLFIAMVIVVWSFTMPKQGRWVLYTLSFVLSCVALYTGWYMALLAVVFTLIMTNDKGKRWVKRKLSGRK